MSKINSFFLLRSSTLLSSFLLLFSVLSITQFLSCQKDEDLQVEQVSRQITIEEIKAHYGISANGIANRNNFKLPLNAKPVWHTAYPYSGTPYPVIMTGVDTTDIKQSSGFGANFAFYKNVQGEIQCKLFIWGIDSSASYSGWKVPTTMDTGFKGFVAVIDAQDTIRNVAKLNNGAVTAVKHTSVSIHSFPGILVQFDSGVSDRDPGCYKFGTGFWEKIGNFFEGVGGVITNVIDGIVGGVTSVIDWIFNNGNGNNNGGNGGNNNGNNSNNDPNYPKSWISNNEIGGGGGTNYVDTDRQIFNKFREDCAFVRNYLIAVEQYPEGYSNLNYDLCKFMHEIDLDNDIIDGFCLWRNQSTNDLNDIMAYWNNSDKSEAAKSLLKEYVSGKCDDGQTALKAEIIKNMYCLQMTSVEVYAKVKSQCGGNFDPNSECVKNIVRQEYIEKFEIEHGHGILTEDVVNECIKECGPDKFITCIEAKILAAMTVLAPKNPITNLKDRIKCFNTTDNLLFDHRVSIFVDQPVENSSDSWSFKESVGHTWLTLEQIDMSGNSKFLSVGFYPVSSSSPCNQIDGGAYNDDGGRDFDVNVSWAISAFSFNQLLENISASTPLYNLSTNNCTTWAINNLTLIGLHVPATPVTSSPIPKKECYINGLNPGQLGQDIRQQSYSPNEGGVKNLIGGNSSPISTCR